MKKKPTLNAATLRKLGIEWVHVDDIISDDEYQRDIRPMQVKWRDELAGLPLIGRRRDGTLVALDGQHRVDLKRRANDDGWLLCRVVAVGSKKEEAWYHSQVNRNQRTQSAYETFKCEVAQESHREVSINNTMLKNGLCVGPKNKPYTCNAVDGLLTLWGRNHPVFELTIKLASDCFDGEKESLMNPFIRGLHKLLTDNPAVDLHRLRTRLKTTTAKSILDEAKKKSNNSAQSDDRGQLVSSLIAELYNAGLRKNLAEIKTKKRVKHA